MNKDLYDIRKKYVFDGSMYYVFDGASMHYFCDRSEALNFYQTGANSDKPEFKSLWEFGVEDLETGYGVVIYSKGVLSYD